MNAIFAMNSFRKGLYNFLILLVYLVTLEASTGSALLSIYASVAGGIVCIKEHKPKPFPRHQVIMKRHLNVNSNESGSNFDPFTKTPFSLHKINNFVSIKIPHYLFSLSEPAYGNLKNRAPPQIS